MTELLPIISAAGDTGTAIMAVVMYWKHIRLSRIERHLWPEVFGGD